ncbi:uncharacterized protein [Ptychodera flava]|uniref:uncharacterized protein n=1 Tax=Ptychodera flava TaxID=63121 RepID=UPI00396A38DD
MSTEQGLGKNQIQLFIKGIRGNTTVITIHKDAKVDDLLKKISEKNNIPVDVQRVLYAGKQLEAGVGKHLSDYYIENHSTLFVVLRLHGGAPPERKELDEDVELTDAPDMITWDDDPDNKRAKMSCGHAIGPESLTAYCRSLLSAGKFRFHCPYISPEGAYCGKEWDYIDIRRLAVLTDDEKKEFETEISSNFLRKAQGIQECPKCHSLCERVQKKDRRIVCVLCTNETGKTFEFCWYCLFEWKKKGSITECGNEACSGEDPRLQILFQSVKKTIVGVRDCPSRRACPSCGMLIEHEKACKHMVCPCGQKFCFICLRKPLNGVYLCGSYNSPCEKAPLQQTIPGAE